MMISSTLDCSDTARMTSGEKTIYLEIKIYIFGTSNFKVTTPNAIFLNFMWVQRLIGTPKLQKSGRRNYADRSSCKTTEEN
jgi:hypothetical protein